MTEPTDSATMPEPETPTPESPTPTNTRWPIMAALAAEEKLGKETVILDVGDVIGITDYFVITSGANVRQVKAIADEVQFRLKAAGGPSARRVEGLESAEWALLDFGDFVVHVFNEDARGYYKLDRLWGDRPSVAWRP